MISQGNCVYGMISQGNCVYEMISQGNSVYGMISQGNSVYEMISQENSVYGMISQGNSVYGMISQGNSVYEMCDLRMEQYIRLARQLLVVTAIVKQSVITMWMFPVVSRYTLHIKQRMEPPCYSERSTELNEYNVLVIFTA